MSHEERFFGGEAAVFEPGSKLVITRGAELIGAVAAAELSANGTGFRLSRGEASLADTNPTVVTTGLADVLCAVVSVKRATEEGDPGVLLSVDYGGAVAAGDLHVYATDPTADDAGVLGGVVAWVALGD